MTIRVFFCFFVFMCSFNFCIYFLDIFSSFSRCSYYSFFFFFSCAHLISAYIFLTDSILFPDVPIALRLSSHLLLGVVRIYSRKVNYLFDDCSEALLKIKQAFRSTAVDLPPEESTAPYHSITLPETFDLDDFELPDNDMFQGSVVHVYYRLRACNNCCYV